ncbi:hypothetical protein HDE_02631 [Halotydeus destructor]|nr:hypothetical protein HDE_02631 [Halotydeus destructor]
MLLKLKLKVIVSHAEPLKVLNEAEKKKVGLVNYPISSIFQQKDLWINDRKVTMSQTTHPYRALFDTELGFAKTAKESWMTAGFYDEKNYKDESETLYYENIKDGKEFELSGIVHLDLAFQDKAFIGGSKFNLTLVPHKPNFYLKMPADLRAVASVEFMQGTRLDVWRSKITPLLLEAHIPQIDNGTIIVNLDKSTDPGSHWVSLTIKPNKIEYFDPLGLPPLHLEIYELLEGKTLKFLDTPLQSYKLNSDACGYFCALYVKSIPLNYWPEMPQSETVRLLASTWLFVGLFVMAMMGGFVLSLLSDVPLNRMDTLAKLEASTVRPMVTKGSYLQKAMQDMSNPNIHALGTRLVESEDADFTDTQRQLMHGARFALFQSKGPLKCGQKKLNERLIYVPPESPGSTVFSDMLAIGFQKGSSLKPLFDPV